MDVSAWPNSFNGVEISVGGAQGQKSVGEQLDGWWCSGKAGTEVSTLGRSGQVQSTESGAVLQADQLAGSAGVSVQWLPLAG